MIDNIKISMLLDIYGKMLTKKQYDILREYCDMDNSLSEIAEEKEIARQSVKNSIDRGVEILNSLEDNIGFLKFFNEVKQKLNEIKESSNEEKTISLVQNLLNFMENN